MEDEAPHHQTKEEDP
jgi:hypothetical protein